jgi:hypothetical protein
MSPDLPPAARLPLLLLALLSLATGVFAGLARLGLAVPDLAAVQAGSHAALMICAFFGTVISLERAVALGRLWAYLAPATAGSGGLALLLGGSVTLAASLFAAASGLLVLGCLAVIRRQLALFTIVLAVGALCWLAGNAVWLATGDIHTAVPAWLAFLVLTIAGERLELTRFLPARPAATPLFVAITAVVLAGAAITPWDADVGTVVFAAGLLALSAWLLAFDIARHNARQRGLARFIALCLLSGYLWLALAALAGLAGGFLPGEPLHDAAMHAIALGFVFAMVFGHAPIIVPAVARVKIAYRPLFYLPLALLHLSLALRVGGQLADSFALRQWGGLANAATLVVFILTIATSIGRQAKRSRRVSA